MGATLACGDESALSHASAAALLGIRPRHRGWIEIVVPRSRLRRPDRIRIHRSAHLPDEDVTRHRNIPVTTPVRTLIDLSTQLSPPQIERAINEADKLDLVDPEALRIGLDARAGQRGVRALREVLDRATFVLTDTELEARFVPIARGAGLPRPLTQEWVNGFRVDFFWPDLGLVVETDGLRYHRTATQQKSDRIRDQAHSAAGLTPLRFTHAQARFEPAEVARVLESVHRRLRQTQMGLPSRRSP